MAMTGGMYSGDRATNLLRVQRVNLTRELHETPINHDRRVTPP